MQMFTIGRLPILHVGLDARKHLLPSILKYGHAIMLVTGKGSIDSSAAGQSLLQQLADAGIQFIQVKIHDEPSPELVDKVVDQYKHHPVDCVVAIGGGSALDAGKAIAGLLRTGNSVMDHLEGVGPEIPYQGPALPFIAVPTTAGTGSEATRNAVLSTRGAEGFKKSFRDEQLVPAIAIIDPALLASCPPDIIAANGMDALTQLIESYVSIRANWFTDALSLHAIELAASALPQWYKQGADASNAQTSMAYAALISGITLAHVGLGSVHGLASPLGAFFPIPHGVVCGTLLAACTRTNIQAMQQREPNNPALGRYQHIAGLFAQLHGSQQKASLEFLCGYLDSLTQDLNINRLGSYGVTEQHVDQIVANARGSSMKTNPIVLTDDEIAAIVRSRL